MFIVYYVGKPFKEEFNIWKDFRMRKKPVILLPICSPFAAFFVNAVLFKSPLEAVFISELVFYHNFVTFLCVTLSD